MQMIFRKLIFLHLIYTIFSTKLKNGDTISLKIYEYSHEISQINLNTINTNAEIYNNIDFYLACINDENEDDKEIFDFYSKYINEKWIFYSNNSETINHLLQFDYENKYNIFLFGIIVPKNINYEMPTNNKNKNIPIFEIEEKNEKLMYKLDIRNTNKERFFNLNINRYDDYYPENYFLISSFVMFLSSIFILCYWNKKINDEQQINILIFHRLCFLLMYLHFFISIILMVKALNIRGEKMDEIESPFIIDFSLIILDGSYRSFIWHFLFLLSIGWNITILELNNEDLFYSLKIFFLIYTLLSIDQFVDAIFDKIYLLYVSEIKNILLYLVILIFMLRNIKKNLKYIEIKYYYANILSPEFKESLIFKYDVMKKLRILICAYLPLFLTALVLQKTIFNYYDSILFEFYNYLIVDIIFELLILNVFKPRPLPDNYTSDLGSADTLGNIYKYKLPKYENCNLQIKNLTKKEVALY